MPGESLTTVRFVLFDAVGTMVRPEPSVGEAYHRAGAAAGSRLDPAEVSARFRREFSREFGPERAAEPTDDELERRRWRRVIAHVFDDVPDVDESLFPRLWNHFGDAANWRLFDDAQPAWTRLMTAGVALGVASNFDSRLADLWTGLALDVDPTRLFASSRIGWSKPSSRFYREVERRLGAAPDEILLVGDDLENDYRAPRAAGWNALWLDRDASRPPPPDVPVDHVLRSLRDVESRLG